MMRYLGTYLGADGLRTATQLIDKLHAPGEWPKDFTDYIDYLEGG